MRRVGNIYGSCKVKSKMAFIQAIYFSKVDANNGLVTQLTYNEKFQTKMNYR